MNGIKILIIAILMNFAILIPQALIAETIELGWLQKAFIAKSHEEMSSVIIELEKQLFSMSLINSVTDSIHVIEPQTNLRSTDLNGDGKPEHLFLGSFSFEDTPELRLYYVLILNETPDKKLNILYLNNIYANTVSLDIGSLKGIGKVLMLNRYIENKSSNSEAVITFFKLSNTTFKRLFDYTAYKRSFVSPINYEITADFPKVINDFVTIIYYYSFSPNIDSLANSKLSQDLQDKLPEVANTSLLNGSDTIRYLLSDETAGMKDIYLSENSRERIQFLERRSNKSFSDVFADNLDIIISDKKNALLSELARYYKKSTFKLK